MLTLFIRCELNNPKTEEVKYVIIRYCLKNKTNVLHKFKTRLSCSNSIINRYSFTSFPDKMFFFCGIFVDKII